MGVAIRPAELDDLPAVAALWQRLDEYHRSLDLAFPRTEQAATLWADGFRRTLGRFSFIWLADDAGRVVAFLSARVKQTPAYLGAVQVGEISDLYVDESARKGGLAAQLVQAAMSKFLELGLHSVEVQVLAGNQAGLDFWSKQGFAHDLTLVRKVL